MVEVQTAEEKKEIHVHPTRRNYDRSQVHNVSYNSGLILHLPGQCREGLGSMKRAKEEDGLL